MLLACTHKEPPSVVIADMSAREVLKIEGKPTGKATYRNYSLLFYQNQTSPEQQKQQVNRAFIFIDDKLIEYSTLVIRPFSDKNAKTELSVEQRLMCWINQQNLPVSPSAVVDKQTKVNDSNCFSK